MLVYARAADGSLALQSCVSDGAVAGCAAGRNVKSLSYSAISPDGQTIVAGNEYTRPASRSSSAAPTATSSSPRAATDA